MAGFEVTKLYATIVPKLSTNFKADLQRQINAASKGAASRVNAKIGVEVNQASLSAAKKKIETQLGKIKINVNIQGIDSKSLDVLKNKTIDVKVKSDAKSTAKEVKQVFSEIEGSSLIFAKTISNKINRELNDAFVINSRYAAQSMNKYWQDTEGQARSKARRVAKTVERQLADAGKIKVNVNDTELEKLKFETLQAKAAANGIDLKVDVDSATAEKKLIAISRTRTVELKLDVDKSFSSQGSSVLDSLGLGGKGSGGSGTAARGAAEGLAQSIDLLGKSFGRMSDVAGIAGVAVSGAAKIVGVSSKAFAGASEEGASFATSLLGVAKAGAAGAAVAAIVAIVLALVAALATGALAAAGFAIAAVVLGAVVSALGVALAGLAAAASAAIGVLGGLGAALGVVALAIAPVAEAFTQFMNVQQEAPKATKAATSAVASQASALRGANAAIRAAKRGVADAGKAVNDAAYGIVRAQRALRDAGEKVADATYNVTIAQRAYRNSSESLKAAQQGQLAARQRLTAAEKKAQEVLISLSRAARDAAGQEEDAEIRLIRAKERLQEVQNNPLENDQTDYREALRDVQQAERDLADQRQDNKKTIEDYNEALNKGVKGNQDVIDAQKDIVNADRDVRDATEAQADAKRNLADAGRDVRDAKEAEQDARRNLADARRDEKSAIDAQRESVLRLKDAELDRADILKKTATATDGSTSAQRKLQKQTFQLTGAGRAFLETLKEVYGWIQKLSGIAQDAFLPGLNTALKELMTLAPLVENGVARIGKVMGDLAVEFAKVFTTEKGQKALKQLITAAEDTIKSVGEAAIKAVDTVLPAIGKLSEKAKPVVDAFANNLRTVANGIANLFGSLAKPEVVDAMAAVMNTLGNVLGNIVSRFGVFIEKISKTLSKISPNINDGIDKFVNGLFSVLEGLINSGLMDDFFTFLGLLGDTFEELAKNGFIRELGATLGETLKVIGQGIKDLFSDPTVVDAFIDLFQQMPPLIKELIGLLPILVPAFIMFVKTSVNFLKDVSPDQVKILATALVALAFAIEGLSNAGKNIGAFFSGMGSAISTAYNFIKGMDWSQLGRDIIGGFIKGIGDNPITKFFKDLFNSLIKTVKDLLGIKSPSRVFAEIGNFLIQGLFNGISSAWKSITTFFNNSFNVLKVLFKTSWETIKTVVSSAWTIISNVISSNWKSIKGVLDGAIDFVKDKLTGTFNNFRNTVSTVWANIRTNISNSWTSIKVIFASIIEYLRDSLAKKFHDTKDSVTNAFRYMRDNLWSIWSNIRTTIFNPIKDFVTKTIPDAFEKGVNAIKRFWDRLKGFTNGPAEFVVNTVYNNGIRKMWNNTASKIPGVGDLPWVQWQGYAQGGKLPGNSGMRGIDDRLAKISGGPMVKLAGGEFVMNARSTKEYLPILEAMNGKKPNRPNSDAGLPGFADGGFLGNLFGKAKNAARGALGSVANPILDAIKRLLPTGGNDFATAIKGAPRGLIDNIKNYISKDDKENPGAVTGPIGGGSLSGGFQSQVNWMRANFPGIGITSTNSGGHAAGSYHYQNRAIDTMPSLAAVQKIRKIFGSNIKELISPWPELNMYNGRNHKYSLKTELQHGAYGAGNKHIHWAMKNGGLVSGLGGETADRIKRYLSNGEFVMNAKATKAIGPTALANANNMALRGSSRREIRADMRNANAIIEEGGSGGDRIDARRSIKVNMMVKEPYQAQLVVNKLNGML